MTPLEQMLKATAAEIDWPATPHIEAAVVPRVEGARPLQAGDTAPAPRRRIRFRRPLVIALAALLLLAGSALAIPAVRDWLGLSSVEVKRVPKPLPVFPGETLGLGTRVTLDTARAKLGFRPVIPAGLGAPTVYYDPVPSGGQLGLAYPRGVVITEVQGHVGPYLQKFIPPGTTVDRLTIDGDRALWIHGALHQYAYVDKTGQMRTDSVRTAGDVLLWRHRDLLVRIEGARSKAQALAIARSAREAP
ncbi:MAG TPA: hypothetical protein VH247_09195 [Thermoleophilaceae bacterium]|nr:hypothetical protein [Thermoleophilaceae bacterium]